MSDVNLSAQQPGTLGATTTRTAMATTDVYFLKGAAKSLLLFEKTGAGAAVITLLRINKDDGVARTARTINVPATTGDVVAGPFPEDIYGAELSFTTDDDISLSVAVLAV